MAEKNQSRHSTPLEIADPGELRISEAQKAEAVTVIIPEPASDAGVIRPVHGVVNYAPLQNSGTTGRTAIREKLRALKLPYSYFHDTPLENPTLDLIDISRLFPIFTADADDPANYRFTENDEYLRQVIDSGLRVIFRLGETIEVGEKKFRVKPPADFEKWAKICVNIVRHYNEGWADGFHWNIRDWAVWEEPNNPNLWHGEFHEYLRLYATVAKIFKARFPHLNIGGPATTTLGIKYLGEFLDFCRDEKLPLDFVIYTAYYLTPAELLAETHRRRRMLDERGFHSVPLWINEWHASPVWSSFPDPVGYRREIERISGSDGAVFAAAVLCGLQDTPIERACFYSVALPGGYGMFDVWRNPTPTYYVFEKFCRLFNHARRRIAVRTLNGNPDLQSLAAENRDGGIELLIGVYLRESKTIQVMVPDGFSVAVAETLDENNPRFNAIEPNRMWLGDGVLELLKPEGAAAFFIELIPSRV